MKSGVYVSVINLFILLHPDPTGARQLLVFTCTSPQSSAPHVRQKKRGEMHGYFNNEVVDSPGSAKYSGDSMVPVVLNLCVG